MVELINQFKKREIGAEVEHIVRSMTKGMMIHEEFDIQTIEYAIEVKSCRFLNNSNKIKDNKTYTTRIVRIVIER